MDYLDVRYEPFPGVAVLFARRIRVVMVVPLVLHLPAINLQFRLVVRTHWKQSGTIRNPPPQKKRKKERRNLN